MPAYVTAFVDSPDTQSPNWVKNAKESLAEANSAVADFALGVQDSLQSGLDAINQSLAEFQRGFPVAADRVERAGIFIRDSFGVAGEALTTGGKGSDAVPASNSLGFEEALHILLTGDPTDPFFSGPESGAATPRKERERADPIELTEKQKVILGAAVVLTIGAILIAAAPVSVVAVGVSAVMVAAGVGGGYLAIQYLQALLPEDWLEAFEKASRETVKRGGGGGGG